MDNENVLEFLFSHLSLDSFQNTTMKSFYTKHKNNGITLENFQERYNEWLKSDEGQQVCKEIRQKKSAEEDAKIQKGLTSIERGNFHILQNTHQQRTYVVRDNETNLYGLITDDNNKEILPCIFTDINVHVGGYTEASFKGNKYEFSTFWGTTKQMTEEKRKSMSDRLFIYAETNVYNIYHLDDSPITKKLVELLKVNHSLE